ncbi:hypothetical protein Tco_0118641 [Tanacetum coccineum]
MEVFINGLPRSIKGNVTTSKPQTLEEAINIAQRLMEQIILCKKLMTVNESLRIRETSSTTTIRITITITTNKYCPRTEVKKMEDEFYNLVVKGNDLKTYIRRF